MTKILLLSIHPPYVEKIMNGEKRFEYRKHIPTENVSHIVIYATVPVKRLVAIVEIERILEASPYSLWEQTKYAAGISRTFFRQYFAGRKKAYALKLGRVWSVENDTAEKITYKIPQSFSYFLESDFEYLQQASNCTEIISPRLAFIAGIHGVGKTFFVEKYLAPAGWYCTSASSIIKNYKGEVNREKKTKEVLQNQEKLLSGLRILRTQYSDLALDGHFTLLNEWGKIVCIPQDTFCDINPGCIIVLTASCELIQQRILNRDNQKWDLSLIQRFQDMELQNAVEFASAHNIPLEIVDLTSSARSILKQIEKLFSTTQEMGRITS